MNYDLIKDRLRDISFEFKGKGLEYEANFIIHEVLTFVNENCRQQPLLNKGHKINVVEKHTNPLKGIFDKGIFDKGIFDKGIFDKGIFDKGIF